MRRERQKRTFKLRLLALALALLLTWYALNPAPVPVRRRRRPEGEKPPEGERRAANPVANRPPFLSAKRVIFTTEVNDLAAEEDDPEELEWPEYISFD